LLSSTTAALLLGSRQGCARGMMWRVAQQTFQNWQGIGCNLLETPRALWRGMGFLHRWVEVQRRPRWCLGKLAKIQAKLAQQNFESVVEKRSPWWDIASPAGVPSFLSLLKTMILQASNEWISAHSRKQPRTQIVRYFAVDATLELTAIVEFDGRGTVIQQPAGLPCTCASIDAAEASVLGRAVRICNENELAVIGSDNTAASRAFFKGYSLSEEMDQHVCAAAGGMILVDIPTGDNYADIPTCPGEHYSPANVEHRRTMSFERLQRSYAAHCVWWQFYFARLDAIFDGMHARLDE
jgi:hypothetical protein